MIRSTHRLGSAHMADLKCKGIWYDNDDEPIQLTDQDDSHTIRDFQRSLIGKVLNPTKQNVVKLIQHVPTEWKLQNRITANDLGNGKFLFNFESEEDLEYVLQQGPFHYNFCMFVLVRWGMMEFPFTGNMLSWVEKRAGGSTVRCRLDRDSLILL